MKLLHTASTICMATFMLGALSACETYQAAETSPVSPPPMEAKPQVEMTPKAGGNCQGNMQKRHKMMKQHQGKMMQQNSRMQEQRAKMFGLMDENGDGKISSIEHASAHENRFAAMDANDDGVLTFEEFSSFRMGPGPKDGGQGKKQNKMATKKQVMFEKMDTDHDGKVSQAEFNAFAAAMFAKADANDDGAVDEAEFAAHHMAKKGQMGMKKHHKMKHKKMGKGDGQCMNTNGDMQGRGMGKNPERKAEMMKAKAMWTKLDANEDGMVTSAEHDALHMKKIATEHPDWVGTAKAKEAIAGGQAEFKEVDTNGDGHWTFQEFVVHFMSDHAPWRENTKDTSQQSMLEQNVNQLAQLTVPDARPQEDTASNANGHFGWAESYVLDAKGK